MDGFGAISWWGFSPAVDFQCNLNSTDDEINILMVGAGDCRHIIKTLAHSYRHSPKRLNFYVVESNLELYARHMLLICLALEPQQRFGLQDKTEFFLEIHGNSLVRQQTAEYVQKMANNFIRMVTDFGFLSKTASIFDLSNLKFKERDALEGIFKFWRNPDANLFDITKCWDLRLRQFLGVRYDGIPNVFDWDFNMKLMDRKAGIITSRNYLRWRHKGVAYEIRDASYNTSNKTLASGAVIKHMGELHARRGYFGDIVVSPYIAFGIESEEDSLFRKANNLYTKTSEDVAEYNVISMLHEVLHREKYSPSSDKSKVRGSKDSKVSVKDVEVKDVEVKDGAERLEKMNIGDAEVNTDQNGREFGEGKTSEMEPEDTVDKELGDKDDREPEDTDDKEPGDTDDKEPGDTDDKESNIKTEAKDAAKEKELRTANVKHLLDAEYEQVATDFAKIYLLSINSVPELLKKSKFQRSFKLVYLSCSQSHLFTPSLLELCLDSAQLIVETPRFVLELNKEQVEQFNERVTGLCSAAGCERLSRADDALAESHLTFLYKRSMTNT